MVMAATIEVMTKEAHDLRARLSRQPSSEESSIWKMHKNELVTLAVLELSWTEESARQATVGQLRLALKENREAAKQAAEALDEWRSPPGLSRMRLATLQAEALRRNIPVTSETRASGLKVREELIRAINLHVVQHSLQPVDHSTSTSGNPRTVWMEIDADPMAAAPSRPSRPR